MPLACTPGTLLQVRFTTHRYLSDTHIVPKTCRQNVEGGAAIRKFIENCSAIKFYQKKTSKEGCSAHTLITTAAECQAAAAFLYETWSNYIWHKDDLVPGCFFCAGRCANVVFFNSNMKPKNPFGDMSGMYAICRGLGAPGHADEATRRQAIALSLPDEAIGHA